MSSKTPSGRRKAGYETYGEGLDPKDWHPYRPGSFAHKHYLEDWLEGWRNAEADQKAMDKIIENPNL